MDNTTRLVSKFIRDRGFNLSEMSRKTNIPYSSLYASIYDTKRDRDLRADEFLKICVFLKEDPMSFKTSDEQAGCREAG